MSDHSAVPGVSGARDRAIQLVVSLASAGNFAAAAEVARSIEDRAVAVRAWVALSEMNANSQRFDAALAALDAALAIDPGSRSLRLGRAQVLGQCGADREALAELESLARDALDSPQLAAQLGLQLAAAGRLAEAEALLVRALDSWPANAALHTRLARLRWQLGAGLAAMDTIRDAIGRHPQELQLRLVAADLLRNAAASAEALQLLEGGLARAPDSATFRTSIGVVLEDLDRFDEALAYLQDAVRRAPRSVAARRNLVPALLRAGDAQAARTLVEGLLAQFPDDQMLIAQRATALRLLGDAEYRELYDYGRLVKTFTLRPAAPYADLAQFNAAFARELAGLHRAAQHPLEQSLRGGSQTERHLPRDNPVIAAFFAMLDAPLREYIGSLGAAHGAHPVDRRRRAGYRIAGSWSVQLKPGGFHIDHVHPLGWLSSAYYVSLPDIDDAESRGGWIKFGEAGLKVPGCGPEHFVKPAAGTLVLFPSYVWHGTVPFTTPGERLTAAFDVVPE